MFKMVDKTLIQRLHDAKIIDKTKVLWWQKGYEGRRVFSEEEFENNLTKETFSIKFDDKGNIFNPPICKEFNVWYDKNIPILLREFNLAGFKIPSFVSVKPMERNYEMRKGWLSPVDAYEEPHIRGVVLEDTENHLFWTPFMFGMRHNYYSTKTRFIESQNMQCFIDPIHPTKFYKNIIHQWSRGRLAQKKMIHFNNPNYQLVPYFEFDVNSKNMMVYPSKVLEDKLDFPIILKSNPEDESVTILGMGAIYFESRLPCASASYLRIPNNKLERVKYDLEKKLNLNII